MGTVTGRGGLKSPGHARASSVSKLQSVFDAAPASGSDAQQQPNRAFVEQVRLLVLGMEQRLQTREERLAKSIERAEAEGARFEELRQEVAAAP